MKLQESGENYLETILILEKRNGIARSVDVANELGFSKPSVSRAVSVLKEAGFVTIGNINQLLLTDSGREIAERIYNRPVSYTHLDVYKRQELHQIPYPQDELDLQLHLSLLHHNN